jgi:hypothetical protein
VLIKRSLKSNVVSIKPKVAVAVDKSNDQQVVLFAEFKKLQNLIVWMSEQAFSAGTPTQSQIDCLTILRSQQDLVLTKMSLDANKSLAAGVKK